MTVILPSTLYLYSTTHRPILGVGCYKNDRSRFITLPKALIIDGQTLMFALDKSLKVLFLEVAKQCHSVICCRVTPLQKVKISIVYICLM